MAKIKIQDLEHTEELDQHQMKGIFGGFAESQGGWGQMLQKGAGAVGGMIGGDAGGAIQAAAGGDWGGAIL